MHVPYMFVHTGVIVHYHMEQTEGAALDRQLYGGTVAWEHIRGVVRKGATIEIEYLQVVWFSSHSRDLTYVDSLSTDCVLYKP